MTQSEPLVPDQPADAAATGNIPLFSSETSNPSPPAKNESTALLFEQVRSHISHRTAVSASASVLISSWVVSTWFLEAFPVFPCLTLVGPAHEGTRMLTVLRDLCHNPILLASWSKADLEVLAGSRTSLISAPGLDKRTAALLGNLTMRDFSLIDKGHILPAAGSRAVYVGTEPVAVTNSISADVTSRLDIPVELLRKWDPQADMPLQRRLEEYAERNVSQVQQLEFRPQGLSPELATVANVLGSCVIDAPDIQKELVALLRSKDEHILSQRQDSEHGLVVAAAFRLSHQEKDECRIVEIAGEIVRWLEAREETSNLTRERVGLRLKDMGFVRKKECIRNVSKVRRPDSRATPRAGMHVWYAGFTSATALPTLFEMPAASVGYSRQCRECRVCIVFGSAEFRREALNHQQVSTSLPKQNCGCRRSGVRTKRKERWLVNTPY